LYGGAVPNAAHELAKLVAQLHDAHHHVTVPGFYEGAENPSDQQLAACEAVPYTEAEFLTLTGTKAVIPEPGFGVHAQIGLRPTLQVTSFTSGYQGVGYRNSIPAAATVKINARLGANQDPLVIREALTKFLQHHVPSYCDLKVTVDQLAKGVELEVDAAPVQRAARILEEVYGEALIPIVTDFATELGVPQVLIPLANEDCHMHAANENFSLTALEYALSFSEKFFSRPEVS
jgi:acetylornithine deacetylase/succinyl-diaminopimelate desuccinylase-like protein